MEIFETQSRPPLIEGAGGGKGGGSGGYEAPNTLENNTILNIEHLLCEGPIQGLATGDGQSIYLNGVPLQSANGSYNFNGAAWSMRVGTPSQAYIPGFANVTSIIPVGIAVLNAFPVVYTTSSVNVDAITVTLSFPSGLRDIDSSGNINGSNVAIRLETKPAASNTWATVYNVNKTGKSDSNYEWQVYLTRPSGALGTGWDIRATRLQPDDSTANISSVFEFVSVTEIQEIQESYDGVAVIGLSLNAEQFGTSLPTFSFLLKGGTVQIPTNYNPVTRVYTGTWDGAFTTGYTNNPAWVLYDLLTNDQYGGGVYGIAADSIDKFSFYNASVFNDTLVTTNILGANITEPRFTFDAVIQQRGDLLTTAAQVAGMMNANLLWAGGLLILNQDRPTSPSRPISKTNVIGGKFTYVGTPLSTRTTAVNCAFQDKTNNYLPKVCAVANSAAINAYGYTVSDIAAFGATSEAQAIRAGKWYLYTCLNQTESVSFSMGLNGFSLSVGDVVDLFDEDYADIAGAGRIVSATSNTVMLDQNVTITSNTSLIGILLPDGVTYEYRTITTANGTTNNLTIANTWSLVPAQFNDYLVITAIHPRTFRVIDIKQGSDSNLLDVTGLLYSNLNYAVIETGIVVPNTVFSLVNVGPPGDPTAIAVTELAANIKLNEAIRRGIQITWSPPTTGTAANYQLKYRFNNGSFVTVNGITTQHYDLQNLAPGPYDFVLFSVNAAGLQSPGAAFSFVIDVSGANTSLLLPPTNFTLNTGGNVFNTQNFTMSWVNPANNSPSNTLTQLTVLKDFIVEIADSGGNVLNQYVVAAVPPGATANLLYTFQMNQNDYGHGTPSRNVYADVFCRDTNYNFSNGASQVFQNPPPNVVTANLVSGHNTNYVIFDTGDLQSPDYMGLLIWRSTDPSINANANTWIFAGGATLVPDSNLIAGTTYYYRWAAYDAYTPNTALFNGTGLNVSAANSIVCLAVGTAQIVNSAVSQIISLYDSSGLAQGLSPGVGNLTARAFETLNITSTGFPVAVDLSLGNFKLFSSNGSTDWTSNVYVYRDGASTGQCPVVNFQANSYPGWAPGRYNIFQPVTITFVDANVAAGAHSYTARFDLGCTGASESMQISEITMKLREIKK